MLCRFISIAADDSANAENMGYIGRIALDDRHDGGPLPLSEEVKEKFAKYNK